MASAWWADPAKSAEKSLSIAYASEGHPWHGRRRPDTPLPGLAVHRAGPPPTVAPPGCAQAPRGPRWVVRAPPRARSPQKPPPGAPRCAASTTFAGWRQLFLPAKGWRRARWRPQRHSVIVGGRSLAVKAICLACLSLIHRARMAVGAVGNGPPFSKARWARSARPRGRQRPRPLRGAAISARVGAAKLVEPQVVRRGDRRSWAIVSGRFCHEAASGRGGGPFPRRFACSVRKLGTSNSSSTE